MARPVCPGDILTDPNGYPYCEVLGVPTPWESIPEFEVANLDQEDLAGFFGAGFVMVGIAWSIGLAAQLVVNAVRRW